jgi:VCBS repeat-containing protein
LFALVALALLALSGRAGIRAASPPTTDALPYAKGFLVTGNYVASGVDLTEQANPIDQNGFSTGTIHMSGVPADADIVAAYLYWETITLTADRSEAAGATFRSETILLNDLMEVKKSSQPLTGSAASCWSSGVPLTLTMFRADVLRWLPIRLDKDNKPTGKRLVNDADLLAHGLPLHQVKLPVRNGNQVPESAGASLVVVYRDPSQPLRKIVFYDGVHIQSSLSEVTTQSLQGFYKSSSATKSAQITHIIGSGQPNKNERVFFDDGSNTQISPPDPITGGSSSQRGWSTLTYDVSALMNPGNNVAGGYGETATTRIDHSGGGGYDCLALGAVIFSTAVADADGDGIPDGLEDAPSGLKDPDGQALPNLNAMGASSAHKDLFIEFNSLWAPAGTSYGSLNAPYNSTTTTLTDPNGHNHMPTPETLKMIGDAYVAHGITPHFDVGNVDAYHALNPAHDPQKLGVVQHVDWVDDYTSTQADGYLVPSTDAFGNALARGGEVMKEVACDRSVATCQFPDFPGTVGWKVGLQMYRDQPVGDNGEEISLNPADPSYFNWNAGTHRRRFDRNRFGLFHYVLYAHARGAAKSDSPADPDFHVPSSRSGVADLPGGSVLVTLGLWDDFVGRPFVRASTTFHEMGHNVNLWHGGLPAVWGNLHPLAGPPTSTYLEPNCKPNYLSSMSYLFQVIGLFDDFDNIHLDYSGLNYSGTAFGSLNETTSLSDVIPPTASYIPAWFAPAGSPLAVAQGDSASTRFCDGSKFDPAAPPAPTARVHAANTVSSINWDGDPATLSTPGPQNVNFDGTSDGVQTLSSALYGFNDWANIRFDQISAGRNAVKFQNGDFLDFGSGDFLDFGSGDFLDFGSGDFLDFGSGDFLDFGSGVFLDSSSGDFLDFGSGDFLDFGSGDFLDFGSGDFLDFGSGTERQELDYDAARGLAKSAPYGLTACIVGRDAGCTPAAPFSAQYHKVEVRLKTSTVGHVFQYVFQRKKGNAASADTFVPAGTSPTQSFIDPTELPNGVEFTYRARAEFDNETPHTFSGWSQPVTITAVNDAPVSNPAPNADRYSTNLGTTLNVDAPHGVLSNDTDDDSAQGSLKAVLVTGPAHGTLTLNADGSFNYTPAAGYAGPDSFTYKANDGLWTDGSTPMSADSNVGTVSITVIDTRPPAYTLILAPMKSPANLGSAVPISWQLKNSAGTFINSLSTLLKMESVFNGPVPPGGCVASASGTTVTLYNPATGATGGSSFRLVSGGYQFNWDTTTAVPTGKGCYTILLTLNDQSAPRKTTPVQLK